MWTPEAWTTWVQDILPKVWTEALANAWDDTVTAYRSAVESDPEAAKRDAQAFGELLFGEDPANPGIWYNIGYLWGLERDATPAQLAAARAAIAERTGLPIEECTGDAMARAAQRLQAGFIKDARRPDKPGVVPLIYVLVVGLVIGIGGLCWATVRLDEARVEHERVALAAGMLREAVAASKDGRPLDLSPISKVAQPRPPAPPATGGGSGGLILVGGLLAVGALGAFVWSRR